MRVFVTGASGFIGTAVVAELIQAGHQVVGLARSDTSAKTLETLGAEVHRGDLNDLESLKTAAAAADGVIHLAFVHDFANYAQAGETDRKAIEAIASVLAGSNRPLVITSGTALLPRDRLGTEDDGRDPSNPVSAVRGKSEELAVSLATQGVRTSVVRLPPTVHGAGDHGFVPMLIAKAREKGFSAYIGDGLNVWPAVHRLDAARLFRLALEKAPAGTRLHGVAEEGVPFKAIAEVIGKHLNIKTVSIKMEEATEHFGWFGPFAAINNPTSSTQTQQKLGWHPVHPNLIPDVDSESYLPNFSHVSSRVENYLNVQASPFHPKSEGEKSLH